jgi:nucleotide-binding universal stress UspA family protein
MFHNILVAIDGSADADQALAQAIDLAESEHARLTVITAPAPVPATTYLAAGAGEVTSKLFEDVHAEAEAILQRARERVPDDLPLTTLLADDAIRMAVIRQIEDGHHDLVVMGSRGRGAVSATLLGSVSHYVLHHSPVPVLIVHEEASEGESGKTAEAA